MEWIRGGSWSVAVEILFFLLFPLLLPLLLRIRQQRALLAVLGALWLASCAPGLFFAKHPALPLFRWVYAFLPAQLPEFASGMTAGLLVFQRGWRVPAVARAWAVAAAYLCYFWEASGISPTAPVREEDSYLKVRRQFLTRDGRPLGAPTFAQNDLVVVKITLQTADAAGEVKNVTITDLLPAGLEIENPRIGAVREITWAKDAATPDYLDVRDDRLNLFTTTGKPKSFYYMARAVSKGTFKLGPISADAMYNGDYHSYNGAGVVRVK